MPGGASKFWVWPVPPLAPPWWCPWVRVGAWHQVILNHAVNVSTPRKNPHKTHTLNSAVTHSAILIASKKILPTHGLFCSVEVTGDFLQHIEQACMHLIKHYAKSSACLFVFHCITGTLGSVP